MQSTSGTKSPRVTSAPVTVTQANASSVSLSFDSQPSYHFDTTHQLVFSTIRSYTNDINRFANVSNRITSIPSYKHSFLIRYAIAGYVLVFISLLNQLINCKGAAKLPIGIVTNSATSGGASKSTTKPVTKATTRTRKYSNL